MAILWYLMLLYSLQNGDRGLWKLGTLPPGLTTFYNLTLPLEKTWHVLGLGYNPKIDRAEIEGGAVIHWNGNLKPWLEIGMSKFKPYWSKYVKYDHPWLQQCNISEWGLTPPIILLFQVNKPIRGTPQGEPGSWLWKRRHSLPEFAWHQLLYSIFEQYRVGGYGFDR